MEAIFLSKDSYHEYALECTISIMERSVFPSGYKLGMFA